MIWSSQCLERKLHTRSFAWGTRTSSWGQAEEALQRTLSHKYLNKQTINSVRIYFHKAISLNQDLKLHPSDKWEKDPSSHSDRCITVEAIQISLRWATNPTVRERACRTNKRHLSGIMRMLQLLSNTWTPWPCHKLIRLPLVNQTDQ